MALSQQLRQQSICWKGNSLLKSEMQWMRDNLSHTKHFSREIVSWHQNIIGCRVNHKVFMPWGIRYRYIRTSSRDRTNSKFSILISDRRILEHLMMDRVFANIFTGYPKIFDIHIQICILCIVVIPTNCVPAYLITSYCTCT